MIYAVPINLRRFDEVSMSNDLPKEATVPSLPHNKRQPYQICCIMRKKQKLQKNSKMKSQIALMLMKTPLIQNASKPNGLRKPCKNAQVEVALLQTRQCFPKNIDLTKILKCQEAIDFLITIEEHQMQRRSKNFHKNSFNQNPNHFSNGWLRLKDTNVLING